MRTRRGLCYPRVVEDKNMIVVKRRRDFAAEQVSYRKRSRNSSDIAGKRDLFDSLPDDLVISILCKLSSSATYPSDFANVLLTCRRLNGLGLNFLVQIRQRIVNKIMETLKRHLYISGQEGLHELRKIAIRFEEKIYTAATSQSDYLRKMSLKMLPMETMSQNPIGNALPSNSAGNSNESAYAGGGVGGGGGVGAPGGGGGEAAMDSVDWRSQLQPDSRQRIVNKIMETLKGHPPVSGEEGLHELRKIAITFEEKIYPIATSQSDYLRKISLKMLIMESFLNF